MKKDSLAPISGMPLGLVRGTSEYFSMDRVHELKVWEQLDAREKKVVEDESLQAATSLRVEGIGKLAAAKHFYNIQQVLEPKRGFTKYMRRVYPKVNVRTVYRRIDAYKLLSTALPATVVEAFIIKGVDITAFSEERPLGVYTEAWRNMKPGTREANDPAAAVAYVENIIKMTWERDQKLREKGMKKREERSNEATHLEQRRAALKIVFRQFASKYRLIPSRNRTEWVSDLIGMIMHEAGYPGRTSFDPSKPPEDFPPKLGRPFEVKKTGTEQQ